MQTSFIDFDYTLSLNHAGSYLSLDDILASSERTVCRTRITLPNVAPLLLSDATARSGGQRDGSQSASAADHRLLDVPAGTKMELPIWLAMALGSGRRQLVSVELPIIHKVGITRSNPCN